MRPVHNAICQPGMVLRYATRTESENWQMSKCPLLVWFQIDIHKTKKFDTADQIVTSLLVRENLTPNWRLASVSIDHFRFSTPTVCIRPRKLRLRSLLTKLTWVAKLINRWDLAWHSSCDVERNHFWRWCFILTIWIIVEGKGCVTIERTEPKNPSGRTIPG